MSNIYIQEPPTTGKVVLKTTVGDIDIELWTREAPKACRNFIQLCLEGYYDGLIFHRVIRDFIVQGGDPKGDGSGGESIYGAPFKDEFHTRLRFVRRGLVAMANAGKDDNGSQFFFTLAATPELQNKHTIFGKVTGETLYNMLKLTEGEIDGNDRPAYPHKIQKTEVIMNPIADIVPRVIKKAESKPKTKKKEPVKVKNYKLLSFGDEAEEEEEFVTAVNERFSGKSKSTHDLLVHDTTLSSQVAIDERSEESIERDKDEELKLIKSKLAANKKALEKKSGNKPSTSTENRDKPENSEEKVNYDDDDKETRKKRKLEEIHKEIRSLKKSYQDDRKKMVATVESNQKEQKERKQVHDEYEETIVKYEDRKKQLLKKGKPREDFTLKMLEKFKNRLISVKEKASNDAEEKTASDESDTDDSWLAHKLQFSDNKPILARDANTKDDNWYEIDDPRNPLNKRRRKDEEHKSRQEKKRK